MADTSSSIFLDFGLLLYLEELNKDEFNKFKLLLKEEPMKPGHCQIPWTEVKKANRETLANLMNEYYSREVAWNVALKIFGKLNLRDMCERAKSELNWASQIKAPKDATVIIQPQDEQGATLDELGEGTEYRLLIQEKFSIMEDKKHLFGELKFCHGITQEDQTLLEHLFDIDVKTGEQPQTVVLKGAAGIGKTTLMRRAMLHWALGNLFQQQFTHVFYLNAREINQLRERSFLEMISKDWPSGEGPIERILSRPSSLLFIIDSFDELNFAFEEPEFALCREWDQVHPVSFLMSSLLRKVMLPECSLLVTTKLVASEKLQSLLKSQCSVELQGMSEEAREEYIYHFFEDQESAFQVFSVLKDNETLFSMCRAPKVCWVICSCLKQQMEKGGNILATCETTTALFTCYISNLYTHGDESSPNQPTQCHLRKLCHLAVTGVWNMTYVFYKENLKKHGLTSSAISGFLDMNILQKDTEYENCFVFTHVLVQEFFAAMCYVLEDNLEDNDNPFISPKYVKLLLESKTHKDPHLTKMKCFLFGLLNEDRIKQLEDSLHCHMSLELKWKILEWVETVGNSEQFLSQLDFLELFQYLYETQDETFVSMAMKSFQKIAVNICGKIPLLVSSFCLKYCHRLQSIKLSIDLVSEMIDSIPEGETRQRNGGCISHFWKDLCSVLHTNDHLKQVVLCDGHLYKSAVKTLYEELKSPNCKLEKLMLRFLSFPDGCQDIFHFLTTNQNLIHLDLKGSDIRDSGVNSLCEALKHPQCNLQNLNLEYCNLSTICFLNISKALIGCQSLIYLNLSNNSLFDNGVKLLCDALRHPECFLERLSLESCGFTVAGCKDLSLALISNKRLTHLCLADNFLGDEGIKFMSDALKEPQCKLQSLVLRNCHFTSLSGEYLSTSLLQNNSLTHLDLGSNRLQDDVVKLLCAVFKHPCSGLQELQLMNCDLTDACCLDLASTMMNNPNLHSLDVGNNDLRDDGVKILNEAFSHPNCNIKRLGLECCGLTSVCCKDLASTLSSKQKLVEINLAQNALGREGIMKLHAALKSPDCKLQVLGLCKEAFGKDVQKLLEEVEVSNPHLVIKPDCNDPNGDGSWWQCF
ncbi:NACHT, LRR and PYD domains-containing protein 14 [Sorex fumeus]|uniref:NACHT, LRR and PYD domains-containing protein 14 n=1 Tax=Sorex fumeus TaxID=62283 RepID=UPI0024AD386E|nr:NACHT, LRR and PYD domains-containing protein 14 [Sorex fumeus]